jgi:DNA-binding response OmpR family regulator
MKQRCDNGRLNQATILQKRERTCGNHHLAAVLNIPISELRPATMDRILIIEDSGALQKILQRLFSSEGYDVDIVPDGVAGLEMLRQRPPCAVIVDRLHTGSSVSDLRKKITSLIPGLLLVILSASSEVVDKVLLLEMGADDYVTIPFSPSVARLRGPISCVARRSGQLVCFEASCL